MTDQELAAVLRGDPVSGDDLRAALADIEADGYVLVLADWSNRLEDANRDLSVALLELLVP